MRKLYLVTSAAALTAGLTATLALSATASTPPGWSALARDSFNRQVSGSWGAPDLGKGYVLTKSSAVKVGTTGTRAFSTMPSGQGLTAQLASVVAGDVHVENSTVLDAPAKTTYDVQYGWVARKQADGSGYSVRVRVNSAGKATLGLTRSNGAASTWLTGVTLPFTVAAGQQVQLEFQVVGTAPVQLQARAWIDGRTVPAWQLKHTDSDASALRAGGALVLSDFVQTSTAAVTVSHDDLLVGSGDHMPAAVIQAADEPSAAPSATPSATAPSATPSAPAASASETPAPTSTVQAPAATGRPVSPAPQPSSHRVPSAGRCRWAPPRTRLRPAPSTSIRCAAPTPAPAPRRRR